MNILAPISIGDLPLPPEDKQGWPWDIDNTIPERKPIDLDWPCLSIITPSYNQGEFIEETIRSVLLQGYPNLEYIIIDGGSTDNTLEIIKKYEPYISYWVSEPDQGQTDALNKGIQKITGEVFAWLNSDDFYVPHTFHLIGKAFRDHSFDICYGKCEFIDTEGKFLFDWPYVDSLTLARVIADNLVPQPSCFLNAQAIKANGPLSQELQYSFDYEYWVRLLFNNAKIQSIPALFSKYRLHDQSKTQTSRLKFDAEMEMIHQNLLEKDSGPVVKQAIANCYKRFAHEHYYWYDDRERSIYYFHRMLRMCPWVCDIEALKIYVKNLLHRRHYANS
jgi:glycosyltransferase involved in cell wall biosynthesis